jgi:hypothetical protein
VSASKPGDRLAGSERLGPPTAPMAQRPKEGLRYVLPESFAVSAPHERAPSCRPLITPPRSSGRYTLARAMPNALAISDTFPPSLNMRMASGAFALAVGLRPLSFGLGELGERGEHVQDQRPVAPRVSPPSAPR